MLSFDYDPYATCPRFLQFLDEVFFGDNEKINFSRRLSDISFINLFQHQQSFFSSAPAATENQYLLIPSLTWWGREIPVM
jgi:hypothetical protein